MYHFGQTPYPYPIPYPLPTLPLPTYPLPLTPTTTPIPYTYPYPLHLPLPMDQSEYFCFGKTGKSEVGRPPKLCTTFFVVKMLLKYSRKSQKVY